MKDKVISMLKRTDDYISGEAMSRELNVSRAAVNGAVKNLRSEGYEILSSTNRGYRLVASPNVLSTGEIAALLPERRMEKVCCLDSVGSTNDYLRKLASEGAPQGQTVIANCQTGGKGRLGRRFVSPADKGIYLSILMRPKCQPSEMTSVTAWTAVAISRAIERVCGIRPNIKWINDIIINRKKISGILTEMSVESESGSIQYLIIGIGVNVSEKPEDFPEEIRQSASSVEEETGKRISRAELAAELVIEMDELISAFPEERDRYLSEYRQFCITPGNEVKIVSPGREDTARALRIDESFGLEVEFDDGRTEVINSGEVSVRGLYGYV